MSFLLSLLSCDFGFSVEIRLHTQKPTPGLTATMVPEGLEGLDSHVLDGTARARLSPEERI